jgi:hypothetical protein
MNFVKWAWLVMILMFALAFISGTISQAKTTPVASDIIPKQTLNGLATPGAWTFSVIDSDGKVGGNNSIAMDKTNGVHISYSYVDSANNGSLKYAHRVGSTWITQTVDSSSNSVGFNTSIAVDSDNNPHISYYDAANHYLKYASWTGSNWSIQIVDSSGRVGGYTSLGLDKMNYPHISYLEDFTGFLKYAYWTGTAWDIQYVTGAAGQDTHLASDSNNLPHISYGDFGPGAVKYAHWTTSGWQTETVDLGSYNSIAVDSQDRPCVSYVRLTNGIATLKYATRENSVWGRETIDTEACLAGANSVALDSHDYPHISYYDTNYCLRYAHKTGLSWTTQIVDINYVGIDNSIAVDSEDKPHISYWALGPLDLWYVEPGSNWSIQTVDSNAGSRISMSLDSLSYPHITYMAANGDLKYTSWTGSSWVIQTVENTGGSAYQTCLVLDSNNYPHISYFDAANLHLKYAHWNGSVWSIQTIDSSYNVGSENSIALDSNNFPYISYYDGSNGLLKCARWTGSTWVLQTVDQRGIKGEIALDHGNNPHIVYSKDYLLHYASWTGTSWSIQTVDPVAGIGDSYCSLVFDTSDNPHISYCCGSGLDGSSGGLYYAHWTGSYWGKELVASDGLFVPYTSLALDNHGFPRITYYDGQLFDLRYAECSGREWATEIVDHCGDVGHQPSIAIDQSGRTLIAYLGDNGLRYARQNESPLIKNPPPVPTSPANGTVVNGTSINFQWNAATGATKYWLVVIKSENGKVVVDQPMGNVTSYNVNGFPNDGSHYVWVVVAGTSANWGPGSAWKTFTNGSVPITIPPVPALIYPANGDMVSGTSMIFQWAASTGATNYWLVVIKASDNSIVLNKAVGNITLDTEPGFPGNNTQYKWMVAAGNSAGWSSPSTLWTFTNGLKKPTLAFPLNGDTVNGTVVNFNWFVLNDATNYWLTVFKASDNSIVINKAVGNVYSCFEGNFPNDGTKYKWMLSAGDSCGWGPASNIWNFTSGTATMPAAPNLTSPPDGATLFGTSMTFQWLASSGATNYWLAVVKASDNSIIVNKAVGNVNSDTETGFPNDGTTYRWVVAAGNNAGWSSASTARTFTNGTTVTIPSAPNLTSPASGATASGTSVTFQWAASTGATNYWLAVVKASDNSVLINKAVGNVTLDVESGFPNNGTTYRWVVAAGNSAGWGNASTARTFTNGTSVTIPAAPSLTSPVDGATVTGTSVTFQWAASSGATNYWLAVVKTNDNSVIVNKEVGNITSYTEAGFPNNGTQYRWVVAAGNIASWGSASSSSAFFNGTLVLQAPSLTSPVDGVKVTGTSITFVWAASSGATNYWLAVVKVSDNSVIINKAVRNVTSSVESGFPNNGTQYRWVVAAGNSAGWGSASTARTFTNGP